MGVQNEWAKKGEVLGMGVGSRKRFWLCAGASSALESRWG
jgi:hypothetical protein